MAHEHRLRPSHPPHSQRGVTAIEITVVLVLFVMVIGIAYQAIISVMRTGQFTESRNELAVLGQKAVNSIQTELEQAKLILQEDTIGAGYRSLLTSRLPAGAPVWTPSRLPIIDSNTSILGPDPGPNTIANRTGNSLIAIRQLAPLPVPWDHDADAATPNIDFLVDLYELQFYYLRADSARPFAGLGYALDIVCARSEHVADFFQLSGVTVNRAQILNGLLARGAARFAWDPGKSVDAPAFYSISGGALVAEPTPQLRVAVKELLHDFGGGRISGKIDYSVGVNPGGRFALKDPVPLFATASGDFPGGLEFQVVGSAGTRKVLTRLVLAAAYDGQITSRATTVITSARGF